MLIKDVTIIATEIVDNEGIFRTVQKVNKSYGRSQNEGDITKPPSAPLTVTEYNVLESESRNSKVRI